MTHSKTISLALLAAVVVFAAITPAILLTAPAVATQLATQLHLSPKQIGDLFSVELGAMSLATLPSFWWLKRVDWRRAALLAGVLFIAANLASSMVSDYQALLGLRMFSALSGGSLMILCLSCAGLMPNPSRAYGIWVLGQLVVGAIGLALLPRLFERYGLGAGYLMLAGLMLLSLPLVRAFPGPHQTRRSSVQSATHLPRYKTVAALLGLLGFYIALSAVWTFVGSIANQAGLDAQASGDILAVATLLGIAGASCATLIGDRWRRDLLLCSGFAMMVTAVLLLLDHPQVLRFTLAVLLFKFTWTYVLPFILASLVELDSSGRLMSISNLVIGAGLALGPAMGGRLIHDDGSVHTLLFVSAVMTVSSLLLTLGGRPRTVAPPLPQSL
ncbi:UNVERIFIED_ORG: putative MFS family arabinose efflux permease [Pseudomonas putida]|nr:putative MFS family arabinose efflux permease [Pseudomonas putida]